jgi:hypothetical protein
MLGAKDSLTSLDTVLYQRQGIRMATLISPSQSKVVHAHQRAWMVGTKPGLASLYHLY